jgi:serine/threonine-protein kinase
MSDPLRDRLQTSLGTAYTLERELGGGGMSRIFVAREEALQREVVVKVLADQAQALSTERFAREIRFAARLQDPHIVPVLTAGTTSDGLIYYTMPFVRGESLRARMAHGRVPLAEAVGILRDVARALAHAHGHGVVHRDIKPENVLLGEGTAVVTDFGIARAIADARAHPTGARISAGATLTEIGTSLGTPAYMSPAQAAGDVIDERTDVYSWGLVAFELLTGAHPFADRATSQQLIAAQISELPPESALRAPASRGRSPSW